MNPGASHARAPQAELHAINLRVHAEIFGRRVLSVEEMRAQWMEWTDVARATALYFPVGVEKFRVLPHPIVGGEPEYVQDVPNYAGSIADAFRVVERICSREVGSGWRWWSCAVFYAQRDQVGARIYACQPGHSIFDTGEPGPMASDSRGVLVQMRETRTHSERADAMQAELKRVLGERRAAGFKAYTHGVEMGMSVRPTYVRDGRVEHWNADAETVLASLIAPSRFAEEPHQ